MMLRNSSNFCLDIVGEPIFSRSWAKVNEDCPVGPSLSVLRVDSGVPSLPWALPFFTPMAPTPLKKMMTSIVAK